MEAGTVGSPAGTGTTTMAGLAASAAERYGDAPALRRKVGEEWAATSYAELGAATSEVGRGLIDLGVAHGERVAILSHTRPEWTVANLGILATGAASVSIYQTNSPEECHYVLEHSEAKAVFVEDEEQLAKIREIRDRLPALEHVISFDGASGDEAISLDDLRERGRSRDQSELDERTAEVTPDDACVFIYTSGTTGPPKGVILSHENYRSITDMVNEDEVIDRDEGMVYLFLPLAHAFALLIQFAVDRPRRPARLLAEGPEEDHLRPDGGEADVLPVGAADLREALHARHQQRAGPRAAREGREGRRDGTPDARARRAGPGGAPGRRSTHPRRRSSRTCATCSAGGSSRP